MSAFDRISLWSALRAHSVFADLMQQLHRSKCQIWVLERGKDAYEWPGDGVLLTGRTSIGEIAEGRDETILGSRFANIHILPGPDPGKCHPSNSEHVA